MKEDFIKMGGIVSLIDFNCYLTNIYWPQLLPQSGKENNFIILISLQIQEVQSKSIGPPYA